jgi:hypothetical protein
VYNGSTQMVSGSKEKPNETERIPIGWSCNAGRGCRLHDARSKSRGRSDFRYQYSPWIPRLEANLRGPRGRQLPQFFCRFGQRFSDPGLPRRERPVPRWRDHCRSALPSRAFGGKQQVFGQTQSFVPGTPTNIQFMVKDTKKYTATGGWGFAHFQDGKPGDEAFMKTCFPCHNQVKARDLVFTRYAQ